MRKRSLLTMNVLLLLSSVSLKAAPIPPEIKSTVAFVYFPDIKGEFKPWGTGFFVSRPTDNDPNRFYMHFVTAKHVLQTKDSKGVRQWRSPFFLRLNRKDDKLQGLRVAIIPDGEKKNIFMHSDPNVDLAVVTLLPDLMTFDFKAVPASWLTTKRDFQELDITEGHEVFFAGLFSRYPGYKKNHPIVRFGRVALVTDEKIEWEDDLFLNLYLIECTSFGGNSGAPVFFYLGRDRKLRGLNLGPPILKLAGVMKGYFNEPGALRVADTAKVPYVNLNSGIAGVIPAYQLHEILFGEELKAARTR